jgi:hypothetical protein
MEKILLFGTKPADTLLVKKLADNMRIAVQEVPVSLYDCTIEQILAVKGAGIMGGAQDFTGGTQNEVQNFAVDTVQVELKSEPGMLLFCDVTEKHLDKFLFELRNKQSRIDYKAVLTPTNRTWNVRRLYAHMAMERMSHERGK